MPFLLAIFLGIVQGLTEFLPVSSSGHLALFQNLFDISSYTDNHIAFDVILHVGTLFSVVAAFWDDVKSLFKGFFTLIRRRFRPGDDPSAKLTAMVIIATLPMAAAVLVNDYVEAAFGTPVVVGICLIVTAGILLFAHRHSGGKKQLSEMRAADAVVVGFCQLFAVFPGISRSGLTMSGGLFRNMDREFATRFAFLLSIPAILGASVFSLPDLFEETLTMGDVGAYLGGFIAAAVTGYCSIKLVRYIMKKNRLVLFSVYCAIAGTVSVILSII